MSPTRNGSIRLFRVSGIDVFLHWSWLIVAMYQIGERKNEYSSLAWNIAEYLSLFLIVLLHEFGHALACRQVGGRADQIMLWPLGGVAYIAPPQRPGAVLWSIAAGPLVNVLLIFPLAGAVLLSHARGWPDTMPDADHLVASITFINIGLLIFNLLPVYPLDGGQILYAVLWFFVGRARSLFVAAIIGFVGVALLVAQAISERSIWMGVIAYFVFTRCMSGWTQARALFAIARAPRRAGFACPSCHSPPPAGALWLCPQCRTAFDTFETLAECPQCHSQFPATQCLDCGVASPMSEWQAAASAATPDSVRG